METIKKEKNNKILYCLKKFQGQQKKLILYILKLLLTIYLVKLI